MDRLISVVLPTYNRENTLMRAVNSVLRQTYSEIELIIVDDGSLDNTQRLVSSIEDKRVRYIRQVNQGACIARNRGIAEANGEFIAFQDSDDEWYPEKLERQMEYMRKTNADVVFHAFWRSGIEEEKEHIPDSQIISKQIFFDDIVPINMISTRTILGKRSCFIDEPFNENYKRFQDWELGMRLVKKYRVFYDRTVLANVYVSEDSISKKPELALQSIFGILHNTVGGYREIVFKQKKIEKQLEMQVAKMEEHLHQRDLLIERYEQEIETHKQLIDEYRLSTSWKITAPLRKIMRIIRNLHS